MQRVTKVSLGILAVAVTLVAGLLVGTGSAQEPPVCNPAWMQLTGGQTLRHTNIELTLPPGSYRTMTIPTSIGTGMMIICHPETSSHVAISVETGGELGRRVAGTAGHAILDQIVAAVRIVAPGQILTPIPRPGITPPDVTPTWPCPYTSPTLGYGGETVGPPQLRVTLPAPGTYRYGEILADPGGLIFSVCNLETNARVGISATTGVETRRDATTPEGNAVIDRIIASIRHIAPTPSPLECGVSWPKAAGGETLRPTGTPGGFQVTLPAPGDYLWFAIPANPANTVGLVLVICHVQTQSSISILARSGEEARWVVRDPAGAGVLDQILASVRLSQSVVRPPDTGESGLR